MSKMGNYVMDLIEEGIITEEDLLDNGEPFVPSSEAEYNTLVESINDEIPF